MCQENFDGEDRFEKVICRMLYPDKLVELGWIRSYQKVLLDNGLNLKLFLLLATLIFSVLAVIFWQGWLIT